MTSPEPFDLDRELRRVCMASRHKLDAAAEEHCAAISAHVTALEAERDALCEVMLNLPRYDMRAESCECCGTTVEGERSNDGEYVRFSDIAALVASTLTPVGPTVGAQGPVASELPPVSPADDFGPPETP